MKQGVLTSLIKGELSTISNNKRLFSGDDDVARGFGVY